MSNEWLKYTLSKYRYINSTISSQQINRVVPWKYKNTKINNNYKLLVSKISYLV